MTNRVYNSMPVIQALRANTIFNNSNKMLSTIELATAHKELQNITRLEETVKKASDTPHNKEAQERLNKCTTEFNTVLNAGKTFTGGPSNS